VILVLSFTPPEAVRPGLDRLFGAAKRFSSRLWAPRSPKADKVRV
jgi:hypothetical protein